MRRINRRLQIILAIIILLLASSIAISLVNYYILRDKAKEEILTSSLPLVREHIYLNISSQLGEPVLTSQLMAKDTFLIDWITSGEKDQEKITEYLDSIKQEHGYSSTFFVSSETMNYYSYSGLHKRVSRDDSHDVWYYSFLDSPEVLQLDVDTDEVLGGKLTVFINIKVYDRQGAFLGVTGVGIDMHSLSQLLQDTQDSYGRQIFLVDSSGTIQVHSDREMILKSSITQMDGISSIAQKLLSSKQDPLVQEFTGQHGTVLLTAKYLPMIDWFIVVQHDLFAAMELARNNLYRSIFTGLAISVFIILLVLLIINTYQKELEQLSTTDHLTGINNRFRSEQLLVQEIKRSERYGYEVAILLLDIDGFKQINDTKGHGLGDTILKHFCSVLRDSLRSSDHLGRWGGDEFLIIAPHCNQRQAELLSQKCLSMIRQELFSHQIRLTTSIGYTILGTDDTVSSVIKRVDTALYLSKEKGKDRASMILL